MASNIFWPASTIIADQPDTVEQHVRQMGEYLRRIGAFIGEAAVNHPNEFIVAVATVWVAIFTGVLAIATIRLWNSTADLARFADQQATDMKASIAAAQKAADAADLNARAAVAAERAYLFVVIDQESISMYSSSPEEII